MRRLLLLSASVLSISVACVPAHADQAAPGWIFSAEGAGIFGKSTVTAGSDLAATNDHGVRGAVAFGRRFDPANDWRVGLAWTGYADGHGSDGFIDMTSGLAYGTADFEIGRQLAADDARRSLRAFAGVRALYARDSVDKVGDLVSHRQTKTVGVGPRAGLEFQHRAAVGPWGTSGLVAGAALIGRPSGTAQSSEWTETLLNFEAAIGLDYHIAGKGKLTAGIRAEHWSHIRPVPAGIEVDRDLLSWGPFVKLELKM